MSDKRRTVSFITVASSGIIIVERTEGRTPSKQNTSPPHEVTPLGRTRKSSSAHKSAKIVIVDDDEDLAEELKEVLSDAGYSVETVVDSVAACAFIRSWKPDVVLLDIIMPGKDGLEVATELAGDPATAGIPIVVMTGLCRGKKREALDSMPGVKDIVTKPFSCEDMVARIEAVRR